MGKKKVVKRTEKAPSKRKPAKKKEAKKVVDPVQEAMNMSLSETPIQNIVSINDMLGNEDAIHKVIELASTGASLGTIEAALGMQDRLLLTWCKQGQQDQTGPFFAIYQLIRKAGSLARHDAERALLVKNPMKWLEANTVSQLVERSPNAPEGLMEVEALPALEGPENGSQKLPGHMKGLGYLELEPQLQKGADEIVQKQIVREEESEAQ